MKRILIVLAALFFGCLISAEAQDCGCYESTRSQAIQLMQKSQYTKAIAVLKAAKDCPDKPADDDLDAKIKECQAEIERISRLRREAEQSQQQNLSQTSPQSQNKPSEQAEAKVELFINGEKAHLKMDLDPLGGEFETHVTCSKGFDACRMKCNHDWYTSSILTDGTLVVKYEPNYDEKTRNGEIKVFYEDQTALLVIMQKPAPNPIESNIWYEKLISLLDDPSQILDGDKYKGNLVNGVTRDGAGIYLWSDGICYFGEWGEKKKNGKGVEFMPDGYYFADLPGSRIIVSDYDNSVKNGYMSCYDRKGRLIYEGAVIDGKPYSEFPSPTPNSHKRFSYLASGGGYYVGETLDGKKHGYGIYVDSQGNCWVGNWQNDQRLDGCIF